MTAMIKSSVSASAAITGQAMHALNRWYSAILRAAALLVVTAASATVLTPQATAGVIYAQNVVSFSGAFAGSSLANTFGPPDGVIIQLADLAELTLGFGAGAVFGDGNAGTADMRIYTIDTIAPAAATIAVSSDGISFVTLGDFADDPLAGYLDFDIDGLGFSSITQIRFIDIFDPLEEFPEAGFDIDAVAGFNDAPPSVPEPMTWSLLLCGLLGARVLRRRNSTAQLRG